MFVLNGATDDHSSKTSGDGSARVSGRAYGAGTVPGRGASHHPRSRPRPEDLHRAAEDDRRGWGRQFPHARRPAQIPPERGIRGPRSTQRLPPARGVQPLGERALARADHRSHEDLRRVLADLRRLRHHLLNLHLNRDRRRDPTPRTFVSITFSLSTDGQRWRYSLP